MHEHRPGQFRFFERFSCISNRYLVIQPCLTCCHSHLSCDGWSLSEGLLKKTTTHCSVLFYFIIILFLFYLYTVLWVCFRKMHWRRDMLQPIGCLLTLTVADPIFLPLLCLCHVHLITAYGEELWWTLSPGKYNCCVLSVSLERAASSLMRLTFEIELPTVTDWELLTPEFATLLQRSSVRDSVVPGKGVDSRKCVD